MKTIAGTTAVTLAGAKAVSGTGSVRSPAQHTTKSVSLRRNVLDEAVKMSLMKQILLHLNLKLPTSLIGGKLEVCVAVS